MKFLKVATIRSILIGLIILLLSACASSKKQKSFMAKIKDNQCLEAMNDLPDTKNPQVLDLPKQGIGMAGSYLLSGIGYVSDMVLYISGGVVVGTILCSPVIAGDLIIYDKISHNSARCVTEIGSAVMSEGYLSEELIGQKIYNKTTNWRCPNLDPYSQAMREVASCHEEMRKKIWPCNN